MNLPWNQRDYDVIVVGSGLGGATLSWRLAHRGLQVLIIEQGDYIRASSAERPPAAARYYPNLNTSRFVGGATKFYGAAMYRLRESDFLEVEHEAGVSPAWPITYAELEPYYAVAEDLFRVHGAPQMDSTEPPRSRPLPHGPIPHAPIVAELVERLRNTGSRVSPIPKAIDYERGSCVLCAECDAYFCPYDAKMDAEIAALRPALATGRVDLITNAECIRVLTSEDGTAVAGVVIDYLGREHVVEADLVAVCAGLPLSAKLLIRSRNTKHPKGLGNSADCVGRYVGGHTTGVILPLIGLKRLPPMHSKTFAINEFYHGSPDWPFPTGTIQAAGQMPFWDDEGAVSWWKRPFARFVGLRSLFCFYMTEALPTRESGFRFNGAGAEHFTPPAHNTETFVRLRRLAIAAFKKAGYRVVAPRVDFSAGVWHATGTVRFGADPESSVLDANCRVHEIDGLYVVDNSVMPTAGAVNTGLTIAALALRVGDAIADTKDAASS